MIRADLGTGIHDISKRHGAASDDEDIGTVCVVCARNDDLRLGKGVMQCRLDLLAHNIIQTVVRVMLQEHTASVRDLTEIQKLLENADDGQARQLLPIIFFVLRRLQDLLLDVVIDHGRRQGLGIVDLGKQRQIPFHHTQHLIHIQPDIGQFLPTRHAEGKYLFLG